MQRSDDSPAVLQDTRYFNGFEVSFHAGRDLHVCQQDDGQADDGCRLFVEVRNTGDVPLTLAYSGASPLNPARIYEALSLHEDIDLPEHSDVPETQETPSGLQVDLDPGACWVSPDAPAPLASIYGPIRDGLSLRGGRRIAVPEGQARKIEMALRLRAVVVTAVRVQPVDATFQTAINVYPPVPEN